MVSNPDQAAGPSTQGRVPAAWSRVLLKLSGEAFAGDERTGIDGLVVQRIASDIVEAKQQFEVDLAVVVGGGNIWREPVPAWIGRRPTTWACSPP
jgi:uridylate kinase